MVNLKVRHGRLDQRRNFFSIRDWNSRPAEVKKMDKVTSETFPANYWTLRATHMDHGPGERADESCTDESVTFRSGRSPGRPKGDYPYRVPSKQVNNADTDPHWSQILDLELHLPKMLVYRYTFSSKKKRGCVIGSRKGETGEASGKRHSGRGKGWHMRTVHGTVIRAL